MSDRREEHQPAAMDRAAPTDKWMDIEHIRRKGGYFEGGIGLSGCAFYLAKKLLGFLMAGILWAAIFVLPIVFDETIRMEIRKLLDAAKPAARVAPENVPKLAIRENPGYQKLSTKWKQVFAEVQLNHSEYAPRFIRFLNDLTLADVEKIDQLVPYVLGDSVLRDNKENSRHHIPGLSFLGISRLQTIGILQQGQSGQKSP